MDRVTGLDSVQHMKLPQLETTTYYVQIYVPLEIIPSCYLFLPHCFEVTGEMEKHALLASESEKHRLLLLQSTFEFDAPRIANLAWTGVIHDKAPPPARFVRANKRPPLCTEVSGTIVNNMSENSDTISKCCGPSTRTCTPSAFYRAHRQHALMLEESQSQSSATGQNEPWEKMFALISTAHLD
jgi:hypothetical protein